MAEIITVYDKDGNEAHVSREWLEQWPDDFTESPPKKKTGGVDKKEAR
jgi:hypothetical protein